MCILNAVIAEKPATLLFDDYETFAIQIGDPEEIGNWLRYVSDYAILEIGVSESDKSLNIIKLVQIPGLVSRAVPTQDVAIEAGLPQFDVTAWNNRRLLDFEVSIELAIAGNVVLLIIDKEKFPNRLIRNDNLIIAFHDGYPCWIGLEKLKEEHLSFVRNAVDRDASSGGFL